MESNANEAAKKKMSFVLFRILIAEKEDKCFRLKLDLVASLTEWGAFSFVYFFG